MKHIRIFDTTLRDGEQSPGFSMKKEEKILLAKGLEALGVDVIEAGFPVASSEDFEAVLEIGRLCKKAEVCALARCNEKDIACAINALQHAIKPRIHVFIATSDIHLTYKLKMSKTQVIEKAVKGVLQAKTFTPRVEFSAEDASRSDRDFLCEVLEAVIEAGADVLNIPDTVGYMTPQEYGELILYLKTHVKGVDKVILSTHCHNDLGMAVANSLAGVMSGAEQVECTINGIGERAGNAALEEIVMGLKTKQSIYQATTSIDTTKLVSTSNLLGEITGHKVPFNKAIVGKNAFAHGSGIHQHGMLCYSQTYEVMDPKEVGFQSTQIILSKHSGKHALKHRLEELGMDLAHLDMDQIFTQFKSLADRKKNIYDEDLMMLVIDQKPKEHFKLINVHTESQFGEGATVKISLQAGEKVIEICQKADGPVSAIYKALQSIPEIGEGTLQDFSIHSFTPDESALGVVSIQWEEAGGKIWQGNGKNLDIVMAAALAFVDLLNRRHTVKNKS
jgi:2-isopropylmalate synthase